MSATFFDVPPVRPIPPLGRLMREGQSPPKPEEPRLPRPIRVERVPGYMMHGRRGKFFVECGYPFEFLGVWRVSGFGVAAHGDTVREACAAWRSRLPWWRRAWLWWNRSIKE